MFQKSDEYNQKVCVNSALKFHKMYIINFMINSRILRVQQYDQNNVNKE